MGGVDRHGRGWASLWRRLAARLASVWPMGGGVTELLLAQREGGPGVAERLARAIRADLQRKAGVLMRRERSRHVLQPAALVHESYVRLVDSNRVGPKDRAGYLGLAAEILRRILVEHALRQPDGERNPRPTRVILDEALASAGPRALEVLTLDHALGELAQLDPEQGRVVELRAFGGLSVEETADVMGISPEAVKRFWAFSRAWLARRLAAAGPPSSEP